MNDFDLKEMIDAAIEAKAIAEAEMLFCSDDGSLVALNSIIKKLQVIEDKVNGNVRNQITK